MQNPYEVLGVSNGASVEDCKKAYRRLSKKYHPDSPSGDANKFDEIARAFKSIESEQSVFSDFIERRNSFLSHVSLFKFKKV